MLDMKQRMCLVFMDMVDKLPYTYFEIDNDYNLGVAIQLTTTTDQDIIVNLVYSRKGLELVILTPDEYQQVQSYQMAVPQDRKRVLKYHKGVTADDILEVVGETLKGYTITLQTGKGVHTSKREVVERYYQDDYMHITTDKNNLDLLVIDIGKDTHQINCI